MKKRSFKKNFKRGAKEFISLLVNMRKSLKEFYFISKKLSLILYVTVVMVSILPFIALSLNARVIDMLVDIVAGNTIEMQYLYIYLGFTLLIWFVLELFWKLFEYADRLAYQKCHVYYAYKVHEATSKLDLEVYESNKHNKFLNKIQEGYSNKPAAFVMHIFDAVQEFLETISAIFFMVALSPILVPILLLSLLPEFGFNISAAKKIYGIWDLKGDERINFFKTAKYLHEDKYIKETKIFESKNYFLKILRRAIEDFTNEQSKVVKREAKQNFLARGLGFFVKALINIWLVFKIITDVFFSIGDYTFFLSTINRFADSSRKLLRTLSRLYEYNLFMKEYYKLIEMESNIKVPSNPVKLSTESVPSIEFKNVSFSYPGSDEKVFDNFSIKIEPMEDIALVGENGAGKTTFVKLLARLYDVQEGEILINGINIKEIELESWHKHIGILFQDFNRYAYSVEDNIRLGDVFKEKDFEKIVDASKKSGADEFVKDYDLKYKKMLSKVYKGGIEISGGQWQKIALARAFFRDANILVLDEPTSSIDSKAEYEIFKKVDEMQREKTTIIISHRFSTVKKAKNIYVIDKGNIVEKGSHQDLMKIKNGKYKEMFDIQAKEYLN